MKLSKGDYIKVRGREGSITGFDWKNGSRVVEFMTVDQIPYWCYKEQIEEVIK